MSNKPCCPRCRHRGFSFVPEDTFLKPTFRCDSCFNIWQYGYDGGEYSEYVQNKEELNEWFIDRPVGKSHLQQT